MEKKIKMISAVTEALKAKKRNPHLANEEVLKHISGFIFAERNQQTKIGMMAAASKALEITNKNPKLTEKEVIREVMGSLSGIVEGMDN